MASSVDIAWLRDAAQRLPDEPDVTSYGSLFAAAARAEASVLGRRIYAHPNHQAAPLLHQLVRLATLERANRR
jgi:hypothetical protein